MTLVEVTSPTKAYIRGATSDQLLSLRASLSYVDERARYELLRFKKNPWFIDKMGLEAFKERVAELQAKVNCQLLHEDESGIWTYSGLAQKVCDLAAPGSSPVVKFSLPEEGALGWENKPKFTPYPYQEAGIGGLLEIRHGGVEHATGLGKSLEILHVVKALGLKTVIMAPYENIAERLYEDCCEAFGKRKVGFFGGGKKDSKRQITVAIGASLTRVEEGTEHWNNLSRARVFCADESHLLPAATLSKVCFGLLADAPYRFFFSATQTRTDGLEKLLEGITGPIVHRMTVREGIGGGYLAALQFLMVRSHSLSSYESRDANEMTREHMFYNSLVNRQAAGIVNEYVSQGHQALVLVEEVEQFTKLLPLFRYPVKFAHGGVTKDNKDKVPKDYWESDPSTFVKEFNAGAFPILIGTSCVSTGTDIKANELTVNLQGGKSLIGVMQGPSGRSTRLFEYEEGRKWGGSNRKKTGCVVVDFDVQNVDTLTRHASDRREIYESIFGPVQEVEYECQVS